MRHLGRWSAGIGAILLIAGLLPTPAYAADRTTELASGTAYTDAGPENDAQARLIFSDMVGASLHSLLPTAQDARYIAVFPMCSSDRDVDCIESLSTRSGVGAIWQASTLSARQLRSADGQLGMVSTINGGTPEEHLFGQLPSDSLIGRPRGSDAPVLDVVDASGAKTPYLVSVRKSTFGWGSFQAPFAITLHPIRWKTTNCPTCSFDFVNNGYDRLPFPSGMEYRLTLRVDREKNYLSSWFNSRISDLSIESTGSRLIISGSPQSIPFAGTPRLDCASVSSSVKALIGGPFCGGRYVTRYVSSIDTSGIEIFTSVEAQAPQGGTYQEWSAFALGEDKCTTATLAGVSSSNAMLYPLKPPRWDAATGSLEFRIASPHLNEDGALNRGQFRLVMHKDLVRCLWGIEPSSAVKATVSITTDSGATQVATETSALVADYFSFTALGFTFSAPTIQLKVDGAAAAGDGSGINEQAGLIGDLTSQVEKLSAAVADLKAKVDADRATISGLSQRVSTLVAALKRESDVRAGAQASAVAARKKLLRVCAMKPKPKGC